jgi:hypothetical protein
VLSDAAAKREADPRAVEQWPAKPSMGGDAALWVASGLVFLALAALFLGGSREPGVTMLVLCAAAALLAGLGLALLAWAIAYRRLSYALTDSALRIGWLGRTVIVPYTAIQGIYTGQRLAGHSTPGVPRWPGINVGPARVRGMGRLRFFATSTDQSALSLVSVEHGGVIVSARDPQGFRAALIAHVERSADPEAAPSARLVQQAPPMTAPWTAVADPWLPLCVTFGTLALLLILGVIVSRFDALPDFVPLRFNADGRPSFIAPRSDLLRLPLLGLACLLVDWGIGIWLHPREPALARVLWLGGAIVQLVLLVGVLRLVA